MDITEKIDKYLNEKNNNSFKKVGELYGKRGKYALYLSPKETEKELDWDDAMDYCKSLGGELPTLDELEYLYDNYKKEFHPTNYWSSSQDSATHSWRMHFYNGTKYHYDQTHLSRVRAVKKVYI